MALKSYILVSLLKNIERSGKLYSKFNLIDLFDKKDKDAREKAEEEFGKSGSERRNQVSKKISSLKKDYSVQSYFNLLEKHDIDPGKALQSALRKLPPISLEENAEEGAATEAAEANDETKGGGDEEGGMKICCHRACLNVYCSL